VTARRDLVLSRYELTDVPGFHAKTGNCFGSKRNKNSASWHAIAYEVDGGIYRRPVGWGVDRSASRTHWRPCNNIGVENTCQGGVVWCSPGKSPQNNIPAAADGGQVTFLDFDAVIIGAGFPVLHLHSLRDKLTWNVIVFRGRRRRRRHLAWNRYPGRRATRTATLLYTFDKILAGMELVRALWRQTRSCATSSTRRALRP